MRNPFRRKTTDDLLFANGTLTLTFGPDPALPTEAQVLAARESLIASGVTGDLMRGFHGSKKVAKDALMAAYAAGNQKVEPIEAETGVAVPTELGLIEVQSPPLRGWTDEAAHHAETGELFDPETIRDV